MTDLTGAWHAAYCRWYEHRDQGHDVRAALWGKTADAIVSIGDRFALWGRDGGDR